MENNKKSDRPISKAEKLHGECLDLLHGLSDYKEAEEYKTIQTHLKTALTNLHALVLKETTGGVIKSE